MKLHRPALLLALALLASSTPLLSGEGDCCSDNGTPGCNDPDIEACVCSDDAWCCDVTWTGGCAALAVSLGCGEDCDSNGMPDACEGLKIKFKRPSDGSDSVGGCYSPPGCGVSVLDAADFDGDGDLDFITAGTSDGSIRWRENNNGDLRGDWHPVHDDGGKVGVSDVDGDGDPDVLVSDQYPSPGLVLLYENLDGSGSFGSAQGISGSYVSSMVVADVDGDGDDDLVGKMDGDLVLFRSTGACCPWFEDPIPVWEPPPSAFYPSIADLNSDGAPDLLVTQGSEDGVVFYNVGGPSVFGPLTAIATAPTFIESTTDLDGDGDTDILAIKVTGIGDIGNTDFGWFENTDGLGGFGAFQPLFARPEYRGVAATDADGDGDQDLIVLHWGTVDDGNCSFSTIVSVYEQGDEPLVFDGPRRMACDYYHYASDVFVAPFGRDFEPEILIPYLGQLPVTFYTIRWLRNLTNDCDGNGTLDVCDPDCNATSVPDACEIAAGVVTDCNGNGVPDTCESACPTCDADGDGCYDDLDSEPSDPTACGDTDGDGCDDCSGGGFDPAGDGIDGDGDGVCDTTDCNDSLTLGWWPPSEVTGLLFTQESTTLAWQSPLNPGGTSVRYDTLRSDLATDFIGPTICLETDDGNTQATDVDWPASDEVFFYLVRPENACPESGPLGDGSDGLPREGRTCP